MGDRTVLVSEVDADIRNVNSTLATVVDDIVAKTTAAGNYVKDNWADDDAKAWWEKVSENVNKIIVEFNTNTKTFVTALTNSANILAESSKDRVSATFSEHSGKVATNLVNDHFPDRSVGATAELENSSSVLEGKFNDLTNSVTNGKNQLKNAINGARDFGEPSLKSVVENNVESLLRIVEKHVEDVSTACHEAMNTVNSNYTTRQQSAEKQQSIS